MNDMQVIRFEDMSYDERWRYERNIAQANRRSVRLRVWYKLRRVCSVLAG